MALKIYMPLRLAWLSTEVQTQV